MSITCKRTADSRPKVEASSLDAEASRHLAGIAEGAAHAGGRGRRWSRPSAPASGASFSTESFNSACSNQHSTRQNMSSCTTMDLTVDEQEMTKAMSELGVSTSHVADSKDLRNDEGALVALGNSKDAHLRGGDGAGTYYCGRSIEIADSDGRCGPNNGPQCASCERFQFSQASVTQRPRPSGDRKLEPMRNLLRNQLVRQTADVQTATKEGSAEMVTAAARSGGRDLLVPPTVNGTAGQRAAAALRDNGQESCRLAGRASPEPSRKSAVGKSNMASRERAREGAAEVGDETHELRRKVSSLGLFDAEQAAAQLPGTETLELQRRASKLGLFDPPIRDGRMADGANAGVEEVGTGTRELHQGIARLFPVSTLSPTSALVAKELCRAGHPLTQWITDEDGYMCDECQRRFRPGAELHGCRRCDYDVCDSCLVRAKALNMLQVERAPVSHDASPRLDKQDGFRPAATPPISSPRPFSQSPRPCLEAAVSVSETDAQRPSTPASETDAQRERPALSLERDFKMGDIIGAGGFGRVFSARHRKTGRIIAVKEMLMEHEGEEPRRTLSGSRQRLERELRCCQELRHERVVRYYGHERLPTTKSDTDRLVIFLEYCTGGSLSSHLKTYGALDEPLVAKYTKQLLEGLSFLHSLSPPVVHRDLKCANLLLTHDANLKIADFGCSKWLCGSGNHSLVGSVFWTAPELLSSSGAQLACAVDLWSGSCCMLEMATARRPWAEYEFDNPFQACNKIMNSEELPLVPEDLPAGIKDIIKAGLKRSPADRVPATELLKFPLLSLDTASLDCFS